jgi:HEAT repeat protein
MNDDPASLSNILADLTNPEKEIRDAAIEAAKQFGSTNAIPTLKAVAANTTDTEEQIALLEAANFLSLPPVDFSQPTPPQTRQ